jgi:hypothetical protein
MAWHMAGRFLESCSCKLWCPCWLGPAEPDQGWCSGAILMDIQQGNSDGADLGGLKVVFVGDWPKDFASGDGTGRLYIDEAANADQRRELEAICSGQKGGPWEVVNNAVLSKWLPAQAARIEVEGGDSPSVRVGSVGQIRVQPVKDEAGRPAQVTGAAAMAAFGLDHLDLARGDGTEFSDPEMRQWKSGGEGVITTFNWGA